MTYVTARQATRAAKAAAVILTAVSCSVYDASLLGNGPAEGGHGGTNSNAGHSGSGGDHEAAGHGGTAGAAKGGSSAAGDAGEAGMMETGGDSSEGGTSGSGGTMNAAGSAGTAGSSGGTAGSVAGSGGTLGGGGSGGASAGAGGTAPATGCAKLSVPIDDTMDRAHFVISFGTAIDMSNKTTSAISMRVYVQAGLAGTIFNYVQDSQYRFFGVTTENRPLLNGTAGWQTITFKVGEQPDGGSAGSGGSAPATMIAKTDVRRVGIEINAAPAAAGWSNPTVVYLDSITVTTIPTAAAQNFTFDTTSTVNAATNLTGDQGNNQLWLNAGTNDTKATGVLLTWQATCP